MSFGCCCACPTVTLPEYENTTEVENYATPPPDTIPPYPRGDEAVDGDDPCGGTGEPLCGPWPYAPEPRPVSGDEPEGDAYHDDNLLNPTGDDVTLERCREGHKVAQAVKQWHGVQDFLSAGCESCTTQTRYRTVHRRVQIDLTAVGAGFESPDEAYNSSSTYGVEFRREYTVDRYTGEVTSDPSKCRNYQYQQTNADPIVENEDADITLWDGGINIAQSFPDLATVDITSLTGVRQLFQIGGLCGDVRLADFTDVASIYTNAEMQALDLLVAFDAGAYSTITPTYISSGPLTQDSITGTYSVEAVYTNPSYPDATITLTGSITITVELDDEYSFDDLTEDCETMLNAWALNNNSYFPWRTDAWRGLGVRLSYRELEARNPDALNQGDDQLAPCSVDDYENPIGSPPYAAWDSRDWFDTSAYTWIFNPGEDQTTEAALELRLNPANDGSVKGSPFTTGWPDKLFDWDHETWRDTGGDNWVIHYYGAFSGQTNKGDGTDAVIPPSASQWTNNYAAGLTPSGSCSVFDIDNTYDIGNGALLLQKHVEAIVRFDRHNFFEPCGKSRWLLDTSKASCIDTYSGTDDFAEGDDLTLEADLSASISAGDLVAIYGCTNGPKVFEVDSISGAVVTLGPETTSPEGIADTYADWDAAYADPDNAGASAGVGILGKLRWPDSTAGLKGSICGRIRITSATQDGADLDLVMSSAAPYLRTGDLISFCAADASDTILDDNTGAGYPVIVTDSTHVTIASLTRDAAKHLACIKSLGAPASVWNTTASRKDYVVQLWPTDDTTGDFEATPTNTDANHAGKTALAVSPNTDTDAAWVVGTMPECEPTTCGGKAARIYVQRVIDPLWQSPIDCNSSLVVCPPYVEAMTDAKVTSISAPALPSGTSFANVLPTTEHLPAGNNGTTNQPNAHAAPWVPCA